METTPTALTPKLESKDEMAMVQEIAHLRKLVWSLRERESRLELQLLEYYGMKEQEAAMRELENQLKINSMETKSYSLKVDSLQAENLRLQSRVSDYSRAMAELNAARAKIKLLKKKLKSDAEQAKERIASLHQRISVLQCREQKDGKNDKEVERKLERLKKLENEVTELRVINSKLERENSDLARRLEATQILASSVLEGPEPEALDEINQLRQANDKLTKDLEQLRTDRCADVEELVYLRWVNACLRYELRNYQAPPGKTVARDLSKSLSPKSEEKAKQLILEYANSGADEKSLSFADFDSEYSSSSRASIGEPDDGCVDISMTKHSSSNKSKFFSKLKRLVLGKGTHKNKISSSDRTPTSYGNSEKRASFSTFSIDDMIGRDSCNSLSSSLMDEPGRTNQLAGMEAQPDEQHQSKVAQFGSHSRPSMDIQRLRKLNLEEVYQNDDETPYGYKSMDSREERSINLAQNNSLLDHKRNDIPGKIELMKYADALKSTREADKFMSRSSSFSN
ncbi:putative protein CHUP1, chloroplastic [Cocos nucifera]|uniref:Protein CHUP1, chloroplastic n=1 Tax=Cocos nucifera TaxID=13894 RepID=A0A8K0HXI7_COCNU|nr:putative protein CHUP1, chloroplastic [Cocos nucifera]